MIKALSYSTCLADAITGAAQRGCVQSVFRAAVNITFPGHFILSLNALDAPRVPNSVQLSTLGGTLPFSSLRVAMPVLLGAQRLHIEALALSLDLTYCTRWHPKIVRPKPLNLAIIEKNSAWLTRYVASSHPHSAPGYPQFSEVGFWERGDDVRRDKGRCRVEWGPCACPRPVGSIETPPGQAQGPLFHLIPALCPYTRTRGTGPIQLSTSIHDLAQQLCGRGLGLTPTGDDILAGWMAANWLLHGAHPRLLLAYQDILAVAERQTHLLSQCWLRYAAQGYVAEPIGLLLQALTRENEVELAAATEAVLALGATSGRDVIHGILLGFAGIPEW